MFVSRVLLHKTGGEQEDDSSSFRLVKGES